MTAAKGQRLAKLTVDVLKSIRQPDRFQAFYQRVVQDQQRYNLSPPCLPRKRRAPRHLEVGSSDGNFPDSAEDYYRQVYYEALDLVIEAITARFNQPGYQIYRNVQDLILNTCKGSPIDQELEFVVNFYQDDLRREQLQAQLMLLHALIAPKLGEVTIPAITQQLSQFSTAEQSAFSQVWILMKLLLVMPATNATSERSFSALRRVKNYLRSTMTQSRLNNLMILHVHKDQTDCLSLSSIAQEFVDNNHDVRHRIFGSFQV